MKYSLSATTGRLTDDNDDAAVVNADDDGAEVSAVAVVMPVPVRLSNRSPLSSSCSSSYSSRSSSSYSCSS